MRGDKYKRALNSMGNNTMEMALSELHRRNDNIQWFRIINDLLQWQIDYWKTLDAMLQQENVEERDRFFMAWLNNLGNSFKII